VSLFWHDEPATIAIKVYEDIAMSHKIETLCKEIVKLSTNVEEANNLAKIVASVDWKDYFLQYAKQYARERQRIDSQNNRTRNMNLEASLTLPQWIATLDYFGWRCAYGNHHYEALDHFLPVALKGGTSIDNCVPSCQHCNSQKSDIHPDDLGLTFSTRNLARINFWLALNDPIIDAPIPQIAVSPWALLAGVSDGTAYEISEVS
jgi:5-methylcytosine-specific restriction endonuclease McrA